VGHDPGVLYFIFVWCLVVVWLCAGACIAASFVVLSELFVFGWWFTSGLMGHVFGLFLFRAFCAVCCSVWCSV